MKTRESAHDEKLRELTITDRGLQVGEPFQAQDAVLTGGSISAAFRPAAPGKRGGGRAS
jgi:hypothetical protein